MNFLCSFKILKLNTCPTRDLLIFTKAKTCFFLLFSYLFFNIHQVTRILSGTYSLPWINTLLLHLFAKYLPKSSNDCLKLSNSQIPTFSLYKTSCFFATSRLGRFFFNRKLMMFHLFVCKFLRKSRKNFCCF